MHAPIRRRSPFRLAGAAALVAGLSGLTSGLVSCAPPAAKTTQVQPSDMQLNTPQIVEQLAGSDFIRNRPVDAPPIVLRPDPMENLSDNRVSTGDQWVAISKVLFDQRMIELLRSKNITVQMPPLRSASIARAGLTVNEPPAQTKPTHVFRARLMSLTRAGGGETVASDKTQRKDVFTFEYTIVDLRTREIAWSGQSEFARLAHGSLID